MAIQSHCETTLLRLQRIVTLAGREKAPITQGEAYEQLVEELELAGFGALEEQARRPEGEPPLRSGAC